MPRSSSSTSGPVTVTFVRRVRPGREGDYERQVATLQEQASTVPGYMGTSFVHDEGSREYVSIVRFDSLAHLDAWEASGQRERWQRGLHGIVEGNAVVRRAEGLEFWFTHNASRLLPPSPHKMALVLVVIVWLIASPMASLSARYLSGLALPLRTFISAAIQVLLLTYLVMPRVTRALGPWLYPKEQRRRAG